MRLPLFVALFLVGFAPMFAHAEVVSSADNIMVDATGQNATDARATAIAQGEQAAFKQVIEKMVPDKAEALLKATPAARVSALVLGYEVIEERMADNRYRATLRYNFDPRGLARIVGNGGSTKPAEAVSAAPLMRENAMLILPVWKDGSVFRLWGNENIWKLIWNSIILQHGEGVLVAPFGDTRDIDDTDDFARSRRISPYWNHSQRNMEQARSASCWQA